MSERQLVSKFELLPNEILFECFEYLNGVDIFHSFDQLNSRFNTLIRNIPLNVDLSNTNEVLFNPVHKKILSDEELKKQVYSLKLSSVTFSLEEFPNLQSLTLDGINIFDARKLTSMLPLLSHLSCFRLITCRDNIRKILSALPRVHLRRLTFPGSPHELKLSDEFPSITHLTVSECVLYKLDELIGYVPNLKYFKLGHFLSTNYFEKELEYFPNHRLIYLKHLILMKFNGRFEVVEKILKQAPNLINLTIDTDPSFDLINANQWERLITSSLPYLNVFKFNFYYPIRKSEHSITNQFIEFQNDFWSKQHHWYIEYTLEDDSLIFYTIPYMFNTYTLQSKIKRYINPFVNNSDTFSNVTDLTIDPDITTEDCQYYFSHVISMTLKKKEYIRHHTKLNFNHLKYLKTVVNLSNLKHLVISFKFEFQTSSVLLELLKEASQLSSLDIHANVFSSLFDNNELCKYLNKMITKLATINHSHGLINDLCDLEQFCKIFSNLKQLACRLDQRDPLLFLLKHLPKLSCITVASVRFIRNSKPAWVEKRSLGGRIIRDYYYSRDHRLTIWFT